MLVCLFLSKKDVAKMIGGDGACCKPIGVCCMSNDILVWGLFSPLTTHHTKNESLRSMFYRRL